MPAERQRGMDHPHYDWSPLPGRPAVQWPGGAPVALAVILLVEHVEFQTPEGTTQVYLPGGVAGSLFPRPNLPFFAHREYGHRIGIFRLLDALRERSVPATIAIDVMAAERYPFLVESGKEYGAEFIAHGISASQVVTSNFSEDTERAYLCASRDRFEAAIGQAPAGWLGPEQSESERTPQLLDELGFDYVCDWPNDEQPYLMSTPSKLVAVPTSYFLDDAFVVWGKPTPPATYVNLVERAFVTLATDGRASGRTLVLVIRPWLSGQPYRISAFEDAITRIVTSGDAWAATTSQIVSAFREQSE